MTVVVFQHHAEGHPGRLGATLRDHGKRLDIRRLDLDAGGIPPDLDGVEGVVSLGGPQNLDEDHPWMEREMAFIRAAHERQLPVVGICLGAQLVAKALGGSVEPMAHPEWGFHPLELEVACHTDTLFAGVPWRSSQFFAHAWQVKDLPPGATLLASSSKCFVQAFRAGLRTYGFQFHFQADREMISRLVHMPGVERGLAADQMDADYAEKQADEHYPMLARVGDRLCVNIAMFLFREEWKTRKRA